jgi:hypothetical protein
MARYRKVAAVVADRRQAPGNAEVSIEPASSTTHDEPQLTEAAAAPEASPAKTSNARKSTSAKTATKKASK